MKALKKFICACFFAIYFTLHGATHFVSLGQDCQSALMLQNNNLRAAAYPFDWMVSVNFYGVMNAIEDDFKHFLDPLFLEYQHQFIANTYYQFGYNHLFPLVGHTVNTDDNVWVAGTIVPNYLDYLPGIQVTQNRRIQRLIQILSSEDKVIFIRTQSNPGEARDFMNMINRKYPRLNALLVIIHARPDLKGDWFIPNVMNFYVNQNFGEDSHAKEWSSIFQQALNY